MGCYVLYGNSAISDVLVSLVCTKIVHFGGGNRPKTGGEMFCKCIGTPAKCEVSINIVPAAASPRNVKLEVVPQNANAATTHLRGDHGDVHPRRTPPLFRCYEYVHLVHRNNTTVSCITALVQNTSMLTWLHTTPRFHWQLHARSIAGTSASRNVRSAAETSCGTSHVEVLSQLSRSVAAKKLPLE